MGDCATGCDCERTVVSTRAPEGVVGPAGIAGAQGADGVQGIDGNPGAVGAVGAPGIKGVDGPVGPTGPAGSGFNNPWQEYTLLGTDFDFGFGAVTIDNLNDSNYYYKTEGNSMIISLNLDLNLSVAALTSLNIFMKAPPGVTMVFTNAVRFNVPWAIENDESETSPIQVASYQIVPRNALPGNSPDRLLSMFLAVEESVHVKFNQQVIAQIA